MSFWATKRKITYLSIIFGILFIIIVVPLFFYFYKAPTCFDGKKNSDETGVDCGGSCVLLCSAEALPPVINWSRAFKVSGNVYNVTAYVVNPNPFSKSDEVSYSFKLYDKSNNLITERIGKTFIPKGKKFAIFEGGIQVGESTPVITRFEFTSPISWKKDISVTPDIYVRDKALFSPDKSPSVGATVENRDVFTIPKIEFVAIVYDENDNAIATSRTYIEDLGEASIPINFTWPLPFVAKLGHCEAPVDVVLALDRSGSMAELSSNPPQPLTDVKNSAISFVEQLKKADRLSVISFANTATSPIDISLTNNFDLVRNAINNISILAQGVQNTNIGDSIKSATDELVLSSRSGANRVLVLLTDGVATRPTKDEDPKYPENYALSIASTSKNSNVQIYTIGLGKNINESFLKKIASTPDFYFSAPTTDDLSVIYSNIATAICRKGPAVIEIIPRIIPPDFDK